MFNILITNGTIIDGSGAKAMSANIGIKDEYIVAMGKLEGAEAKVIIDAQGCIVTPGFIDIHTHSDFSVQTDNNAESQIRQGVTTEVIGLCGYSNAPCSDLTRANIVHNVNENKGYWNTFAQYLEALEICRPSTNLACLVGHSTLRYLAMPLSSRTKAASQKQIEYMQNLLGECLEQGAFGMSTGLEYFPGRAASLYEIESLCNVLVPFDALHAAHMRNRDTYILNGLTEVLEIAHNTQSRLQISHINPKYSRSARAMEQVLKLISWIRDEGMYIGMDIIPSIWNHSAISALLPLWALDLPLDERLAILKDPVRNSELRYNHEPFMNLHIHGHWNKIRLITAQATKRHLGKTIAAIAEEYKGDEWDAIFALLAEEGKNMDALHFAGECFAIEDMIEALYDPFCSVGSDSASSAINGPLQGFIMAPNTFEWVITFLKSFIQEKKILSLEQGIRRLTSLPAEQIKLKKRGLLKENYFADLAIINMAELGTNATFENPAVYPSGIQTVIVNGEITLNGGVRKENHSGKVLRSM